MKLKKNKKLKKKNNYRNKTFVPLRDIDIEKVSNKISFGEKNYNYFIGYLYNDHKVQPLHIMLPKTSAYVKNYDRQPKWMYFFLEDDLLEKHNTI